jgi:hypothetical protein
MTGALDFTVDASYQITGMLSIAGSSRAAYAFSAGVFGLTGTVDPVTGAFTMTGDIPGSGPFSISGYLPNAAGTAGYTLTAGGETYSGAFAPLPSPTASPSPSASPVPLAGGSATASFTNIVGTDAVLDTYSPTDVNAKKIDNLLYDVLEVASVEERRYSSGNASILATRQFTVNVTMEKGTTGPARVSNPQNPDTSKPPIPVVTIFFYSYVTGSSLADARPYVAESGDVEVLTNNGTEVRVRVKNARMVPLKPFSSALPEATGSFILDGEIYGMIK